MGGHRVVNLFIVVFRTQTNAGRGDGLTLPESLPSRRSPYRDAFPPPKFHDDIPSPWWADDCFGDAIESSVCASNDDADDEG